LKKKAEKTESTDYRSATGDGQSTIGKDKVPGRLETRLVHQGMLGGTKPIVIRLVRSRWPAKMTEKAPPARKQA
jgi:hypothetical protein